jgi:maltooligosyltrehalose trehalohydrolase
VRFGPQIHGAEVLFRLWSPSRADVLLELKDKGRFRMSDAGNGWRETRMECAAGQRYRFCLDDVTFPDPASRSQDGGVHGWSVVLPRTIPVRWAGRPWEETVLYECHPGLMGGFQGISEKLEALSALGISAIELMPIAAFPGAHNWGYDGVLPFAPAEAYGTLRDLAALLDHAHSLNMMVFLDVVYNHFGPDGNYLPLYAKSFFRSDVPTPWGAAIDFRVPQVREFYEQNARYWLFEVGFDGLRFDAVHAIVDEGWLDGLAATLRQVAGDRQIHLVLENEDNIASHLRPKHASKQFDAQWNDDIHHALHVLLTGETSGYYQDFADKPAALLARGLSEGFIYQGDKSANRQGEPRGEPSSDLPPSAFVAFLQNHDQIGNRAFGERLTLLADPDALRAAMVLLLLMPQVPMLFMGEESGSRAPFLYFTDHGPELAKAVREGRRKEFAAFHLDGGKEIPDPNAHDTFRHSDPASDAAEATSWRSFIKVLLALRREHILPGIKGAVATGAQAISEKAVVASWRLGDGKSLTIGVNLGTGPAQMTVPAGIPLWGSLTDQALEAMTCAAWLGE